MWLAWGRTMCGWALLERGRAEEGMTEITVGMAGAQVAHSSVMKIHFLSQLAEAFGRLGYVSEGVTMVEEGFADLEPTDERVSEAELHRSRGLLHLAANDESVTAEACFRQGIEVARRQQALLLELRSATALAELLAGEERPEEARVLLEDVTGRFTQGLGTPVLRNANDLLERVGGARG
jgi:predicted ATPase